MENTPVKQILLVIFDGWGYSKDSTYNAITQANPEYFNMLWNNFPHTLLKASGEAVGLPEGQIGTSEIAHTELGAGRVVYTDMLRIAKDIKENTLKNNETINKLFVHVKKNNSTLHLLGMVSPGGVHSHQDHLFALLRLAKAEGITNVVIHAITDGRDEPPFSGDGYMQQLLDVIKEVGIGKVVTISGRYYAMDRDTNWERTEKEEKAIFDGEGEIYEGDPVAAIKQKHTEKIGDEFIPPIILPENGKPVTIKNNDGVFFFNFRPDRARQISRKIVNRAKNMNLCFVTMTEYDKTLDCPIAYPRIKIEHTLGEVLAEKGYTQAHIAETEKFAHVTYFFDGERKEPFPNEQYELIESQKVATHDLAPEMRAKEIADKTIAYIEKNTQFIVINLANADMVGHTGKMEPAVHAIKELDRQLGRIIDALHKNKGVAFITADHGNAELMWDEKNDQAYTAHTINPVPAILTKNGLTLHEGTLADVAPTILSLFQISQPDVMSGKSLID